MSEYAVTEIHGVGAWMVSYSHYEIGGGEKHGDFLILAATAGAAICGARHVLERRGLAHALITEVVRAREGGSGIFSVSEKGAF